MFGIDSTLYKYIVLSNTIEHLLNCVRRVRPYILHLVTHSLLNIYARTAASNLPCFAGMRVHSHRMFHIDKSAVYTPVRK
jgi:hypothetical protein